MARGAGDPVKRRELDRVQAQLKEKRREIELFRREVEEAAKDLTRLRSERERSARRIDEIESRRRESERQRRELADRLVALTLAYGDGMGVVRGEARGRALAAAADSGYYGRAGLWEGSFRAAALREKAVYLARLRSVESRTVQARLEAQRRGRELSAQEGRARSELRTRQSLYREKETAFQETRQKVARTLKEVRELEDTARALGRLLAALERRGGRRRGPVEARAVPVERGSLPWPAAGRVTARFGKERVAELETWIIRTGIEIATPPGAPVSSVAEGTVIFAGPFRSYGNVLIVDHGGGLCSIYGRLGSFARAKGEVVAARGAIGSAGAAPGEAEGRAAPGFGIVYFELRQSGSALDPLDWLQKGAR